jgi:hypothetical protein
LPSNLNSQSILRSIAATAKEVGTLFTASPKQAQILHANSRRQTILLISPSDLEKDQNVVLEAPAVELTTFDAHALEKIKGHNRRVPVIVRLPLTTNSDRFALEFAEHGVDAIHLFANYHGEGGDIDNPEFIKDLIRRVHRALAKESLRDEVTLIASGGITLAEHVPKAIICGADLVALDTTILVALQAQLLGECISPESGRIKPEEFDPNWGRQRLVNLLASWHDQLIEILSAMGMRDVRRLRGDAGRAMFNEDLEKEAFADIQRIE